LHFFDGFPDDETVQRLYDNLDFQRAVQAFLTAMPAASLAAMREGLRSIGVSNTTVAIFETLMDSRSLFLTANTESIYTVGWLDLSEGPLVVETPPNVLGLIDDFWCHYVCDIGNAGPDEGEGGKVLLLPPAYRGEVPAGYHVFRSNTYGNWLLIRGFMVDGDPAPAVRRIKATLRIYPVARTGRPPHTHFVNASGRSFNTIHATDATFFEAVNRVVQEEPAIAIDAETLGLLASIGIEKGTPFAPDARMTQILQHAAAVGHATARALSYQSRLREQYLFDDRHYITPFVGGSHEFLRGERACSMHAPACSSVRPVVARRWPRDCLPARARNMPPPMWTTKVARSTAVEHTGSTCRRTSRPETSGQSWCTTHKPDRC
jgi:hypothetical protein